MEAGVISYVIPLAPYSKYTILDHVEHQTLF